MPKETTPARLHDATLTPGIHTPSIMHLVPVDGIGGVEVAADSMAARTDLTCRFHLQFIESEAPSGRSIASILRVIGGNWRALRKAQALKPDIILFSLWRSVPVALALRSIQRRTKFVYFIHSSKSVHRYDAFMSGVARRFADEVWGDSFATLQAHGIPPEHGRVISFVTNRVAIPNKNFTGASFVSWGRLHHQKGYDRAIRLVGLLAQRGLDVRYTLYGPDGGERDALTLLARDLGIEQRVDFPGPIAKSEIARISERHAFFLQLSRLEGMCMAAVEAMQLGLVPIATPVGEMANYVRPGDTGIAVDPEQLETAADAVTHLIQDEATWRRYSNKAIRYWQDAPLYAEDVCRAAHALVRRI